MGHSVVSRVTDDESTKELKAAANDLRAAIAVVRNLHYAPIESMALPITSGGWNFETFEKYINQRFGDLSLQLRERYEAQQTGVTAALAAAEKAVNAALIAAEKAVDKAEGAQQLRNEAQNEFRKSLSDLSGLMWTIKEGTEKVDSLRRELNVTLEGLKSRTNSLESNYSNIQGRIWGVSALFSIAALIIDIVVRYMGPR